MTGGLDFDFSFADEELEQKENTYTPMPRGWYTAGLQDGIGLQNTEDGNQVFVAPFSEFETEAGERYIDNVGGIGGRHVDWTVWFSFNGETRLESIARGLVAMARAFGFAVQTPDGKWTISQFLSDPEQHAVNPEALAKSFADDLGGFLGSRCRVEIFQKRRQVGERTYVDERIRQVRPL